MKEALRNLLGMIKSFEAARWVAIPYSRHGKVPKAPEDTSWEAAKVVKDASADQLKMMCLFEDKSALENKESYKFPHHLTNGNVVLKGCYAAMQRMMQGFPLGVPETERKKGYEHLVHHYKDFDKKPEDIPEWHMGIGDDAAVYDLDANLDPVDSAKFGSDETVSVETDIFDTGVHHGKHYEPEDLKAVEDNWNALKDSGRKVPLIAGHGMQELLAKTGLPAFGWLTKLWSVARDGGMKLRAVFSGVPKKLAAIIERKGFRTVSVELDKPKPDEKVPHPDGYKVLSRVALMGGDLPEVKTLDDILVLYGAATGAFVPSFSTGDDAQWIDGIEYVAKTEDKTMKFSELKTMADFLTWSADPKNKDELAKLDTLVPTNTDLSKLFGAVRPTEPTAKPDDEQIKKFQAALAQVEAEKKVMETRLVQIEARNREIEIERDLSVFGAKHPESGMALPVSALNDTGLKTFARELDRTRKIVFGADKDGKPVEDTTYGRFLNLLGQIQKTGLVDMREHVKTGDNGNDGRASDLAFGATATDHVDGGDLVVAARKFCTDNKLDAGNIDHWRRALAAVTVTAYGRE